MKTEGHFREPHGWVSQSTCPYGPRLSLFSWNPTDGRTSQNYISYKYPKITNSALKNQFLEISLFLGYLLVIFDLNKCIWVRIVDRVQKTIHLLQIGTKKSIFRANKSAESNSSSYDFFYTWNKKKLKKSH